MDLGRGVMGSYMYRDQPCQTDISYAPTNWSYQVMQGWESGRILYEKPAHIWRSGDAWFKTDKALGNRAIVSDSFAKSRNVVTQSPGDGWFAHKDGYNVLYGDGSAQWYGDPQQKLIYWPSPVSAAWTNMPMLAGNQCNILADMFMGSSTDVPPWHMLTTDSSGVLEWHQLDVFHGIDVDADANLPGAYLPAGWNWLRNDVGP
jgi:prepilin-type processing-associated H-X9-DG protein